METTPYYVNKCDCKNFAQDLLNWNNELLIIDEESSRRTVLEQYLREYSTNNVCRISANNSMENKNSCSIKVSSMLLQRLTEFGRLGMDVSTVLFNLICFIYLKKCGQLCCCLVWNMDKAVYFPRYTKSDENDARVLSAFRGKPDFMKVLMKFGLVPSLSERSSFMIAETKRYLNRFIRKATGFHASSIVRDVIKTVRHKFLGNHPESYKRLFLVAIALQAVQVKLNNEDSLAEDFITCLRMYFSATNDLFLTTFEVKGALYTCFSLTNKLDLFVMYSQQFDMLMSECPDKMEPRKLTNLARCEVRQNLSTPLPIAAEKLHFPNRLKRFLLGEMMNTTQES